MQPINKKNQSYQYLMQVFRVEKIRCGYEQTEVGVGAKQHPNGFSGPVYSKKFGIWTVTIYRIVKSGQRSF